MAKGKKARKSAKSGCGTAKTRVGRASKACAGKGKRERKSCMKKFFKRCGSKRK